MTAKQNQGLYSSVEQIGMVEKSTDIGNTLEEKLWVSILIFFCLFDLEVNIFTKYMRKFTSIWICCGGNLWENASVNC